jgi:malonyl-CoA/methylmalonyl-CoA synthetase
VETRIVADTGELWVRGPSVFPGYWRRPEATAAAFAAGGWFMTGDVASLDDDGYVRLLGRTSQDILKSGGYKLSALEIEEVLREHPDVGDVAVIGIADETWGEKVVAVVEARPGRQVAGDDVRAWAKTRLAAYKTPREVIVVAALPRNPMGKVTKGELRKTYG